MLTVVIPPYSHSLSELIIDCQDKKKDQYCHTCYCQYEDGDDGWTFCECCVKAYVWNSCPLKKCREVLAKHEEVENARLEIKAREKSLKRKEHSDPTITLPAKRPRKTK